MAVLAWRSATSAPAPSCPSSAAMNMPTRLPPTIRTGTSLSSISRVDISEPARPFTPAAGEWGDAALAEPEPDSSVTREQSPGCTKRRRAAPTARLVLEGRQRPSGSARSESLRAQRARGEGDGEVLRAGPPRRTIFVEAGEHQARPQLPAE